MADQQQLDVLRQGVTALNIWREQHRGIHLNLSGADLRAAHLSGANLSHANLITADLRGADLRAANLNEALLSGANLSGAYFIGADLSFANLKEAILSHANLSGADLRATDLSHANLSGAILSGAILSGATVGLTIFGNVDLRTAKGLDTLNHLAPSTIGTDTLLRSEGDIPESFLRKAGLSDTFITYTRSLVQSPITYYTCFISYSSKDQAFVERLYADLQANDVRCWYAREDLKIGDEFQPHIDEAIRVYDKLIVILSQHSVESSWVEYEVNKALKKEQAQGKLVLFPLKLDETIMETPEAWAAAIRKKRHIGDFTTWKAHDAYHAAFQRLLRDLQARSTPPPTHLPLDHP